MVARGDLGVEIGAAQVPLVQKRMIERARGRQAGHHRDADARVDDPRSREPTRAEVSDVANAILDGTDAVMLSAETAVGEYPARARWRR